MLVLDGKCLKTAERVLAEEVTRSWLLLRKVAVSFFFPPQGSPDGLPSNIEEHHMSHTSHGGRTNHKDRFADGGRRTGGTTGYDRSFPC